MRTRTILILAGLTLVAAALRFWHLGARDIWTDEAISISIARLPWHEFRRVITNREANAAFYELLLKFWTAVFGTSETAVRSLSAIAGAFTVPALFVAGRCLVGTWGGLCAAALLTVNAYHVRYSQEARGYALVAFLVTAATIAFLRIREMPRASSIVSYVALSVLAVYSHMFAVFVVAAHALVACFDAPAVRRRLFIAISIVAVFSAPLALFAKTKDVGQIAWIEKPTLDTVSDALWKLSGHGGALLGAAFWAAVILGCAFLLVDFRRERTATLLISGWAFLPIALAVLVSLRKPIFLARYLIVAQPGLVLLAATALTYRMGQRRWGHVVRQVFVFVLIVVLCAGATRELYSHPFDPPPQHWRELVRTLAAESQANDTVVCYHPYMRMPFEYNRAQLEIVVPAPVLFPPIPDAGMMIAPLARMDSKQLLPPATLSAELAARRRVWLVRSSPPDATSDALQSYLRNRFGSETHTNYGAGVDLFVYSRAANSIR